MNPEPLRDKVKHKLEDYWYFEYYEIKSAVEWLKKELDLIAFEVKGNKWLNLVGVKQQIDKAFEDIK